MDYLIDIARGTFQSILNGLLHNFDEFVPLFDEFGNFLVNKLQESGGNREEMIHQLMECEKYFKAMLLDAKEYLNSARDTLKFASVDESKLSELKQKFEKKNYEGLKPFLNHLSDHFAGTTESLEKLLAHQNSDTKRTCDTFLLNVQKLTEGTRWIGGAVSLVLVSAGMMALNPACGCMLLFGGAVIFGAVSYFDRTGNANMKMFQKLERIYNVDASVRTSSEEVAVDMKSAQGTLEAVKNIIQHPTAYDLDVFGREVNILMETIDEVKMKMFQKVRELDEIFEKLKEEDFHKHVYSNY